METVNSKSELVIGIVTTVGTSVDVVIQCIADRLQYFRYNTVEISVSKDILAKFEKDIPSSTEYERISHYMDLGNQIRQKTGDFGILMKGVASLIFERRGPDKSPQEKTAYVVKSLKHPDEVDELRRIYGTGFHLIGITSDYDLRKSYLVERKTLTSQQANELLNRDENENAGHGQHTRDAFQQADYFINVGLNNQLVQNTVFRLMDLLFGNPFITPTFDEFAMFMAYASSLRSADLSRQIGAVIAYNNEIIASGSNDCPKAHGGLYWSFINDTGKYCDTDKGRDYMLGYDSNKIEQTKLIESILTNLELPITDENVAKIKNSGIKDLTEYGRVVHAEMEALLMCSRNNISCKGATLYATTFPCHNCAKHIIAAGISQVIYIEPYPKSKALEFYKAEITQNEKDTEKIRFIPFVGVGPHKFIELFAVGSMLSYSKVRKDSFGKLIPWENGNATLRNPMTLMTYLDSEEAAYKVFFETQKNMGGCINAEC